jgi:predicted MPP superfamily phosphohydrolase
MLYYALVALWVLSTAVLWWRVDRLARRLRGSRFRRIVQRTYRILLACFVALSLFFPVILLVNGVQTIDLDSIPQWLVLAGYLWCVAVLTPIQLLLIVWGSFAGPLRLFRHVQARRRRAKATRVVDASAAASKPATEPDTTPAWSRRDALWLAAAALPPVVSTALAAAAAAQVGAFRIRRETLFIPSLPRDLDGLSVTHLTDLHVGNFLGEQTVDAVAAAVDELKPELVVFTGDLIDRGLLYRVPRGFRLIDHIMRHRRYPFAMIEGNHDVIGNALVFEKAAREGAGQNLLLDEQLIVHPRGRYFSPVQLLGITWGKLTTPGEMGQFDSDPDRPIRVNDDGLTAQRVSAVATLRQPGAFPILLAHHPHALDAAAEADLPLTLAGHSHGGQMMLSDHVGVGPMRFRYWAGTHRRGNATMSISNGIGAWFPLRVNAPAEIVHLTLRVP